MKTRKTKLTIGKVIGAVLWCAAWGAMFVALMAKL